MSFRLSLAITLVLADLAVAAVPSASSSRGFAIYRLPGRSGRSCLTCHGARPPEANEQFDVHIAEQFGKLDRANVATLLAYVKSLSQTNQPATIERDELVASMRSLGYVNYTRAEPLPQLAAGVHLNAFELNDATTNGASLFADKNSPTGQSVKIPPSPIAGIVLPPFSAEVGTYRITIRSTAPIAPDAFRLLVTSGNAPHRATPLQRGANANEAIGVFRVDRASAVTIAIALRHAKPIIVSALEMVPLK